METNNSVIIKEGFDNKITKLMYSVPIAKDGNIVDWIHFDTKQEADDYILKNLKSE